MRDRGEIAAEGKRRQGTLSLSLSLSQLLLRSQPESIYIVATTAAAVAAEAICPLSSGRYCVSVSSRRRRSGARRKAVLPARLPWNLHFSAPPEIFDNSARTRLYRDSACVRETDTYICIGMVLRPLCNLSEEEVKKKKMLYMANVLELLVKDLRDGSFFFSKNDRDASLS